MSARLFIAAGVTGFILALFAAGLIANGVGQWRDNHRYDFPEFVIPIFQTVISASITILTMGGLSEKRQRRKIKDKQHDDCSDE